jgi:putative sterol carrier protein
MNMPAASASLLRKTLIDFQTRFNGHVRVKKLTKSWDRDILLRSTDHDHFHMMIVRGENLLEVKDSVEDAENDIYIIATDEILIRIFSGDYNPANALLDGMVELYCADKDKVKLEAISMVMWGMQK